MEKALVSGNQEEIKIGTSVTIGTYLLPRLVQEFTKKYPSIHINSIVNNTKDIENLIIKNAVDFGMVEGQTHSNEFKSIPFFVDE